jgi:hypothetical protein
MKLGFPTNQLEENTDVLKAALFWPVRASVPVAE